MSLRCRIGWHGLMVHEDIVNHQPWDEEMIHTDSERHQCERCKKWFVSYEDNRGRWHWRGEYETLEQVRRKKWAVGIASLAIMYLGVFMPDVINSNPGSPLSATLLPIGFFILIFYSRR